MYNLYSVYTYNNNVYDWLLLDVSPLNFGWDGIEWIHNYSGSKITHHGHEDLPLYGSIGFGDDYWERAGVIEMVGDTPGDHAGWDYHDGISENYVIGEYYSFAVNPSGYVFDNTMAYTAYSWVYTGVPQYKTETGIFLSWPDPLVPSDIPITLEMAVHPDWLCVETSGVYFKVTFDGNISGKAIGSTYCLSYFGEYNINAITGVMTFHQDCNGHTVDIEYYWIKREV
jgi:hypothetical protein